MRRAGNGDHGDAKAEGARGPVASVARLAGDPVELAALLGADKRRAQKDEQRQRDIDLQRRGAVQANAPAERRPRRPLGAQQHLGPTGFERSGGQPRQSRPFPSEYSAQLSHDPSRGRENRSSLSRDNLKGEVVALIVNIRFKNPRRDGVRVRALSFLRHFPPTLGKAQRVHPRRGADSQAREGAICRPARRPRSRRVRPHDREWLHRPPAPHRLRNKTQS